MFVVGVDVGSLVGMEPSFSSPHFTFSDSGGVQWTLLAFTRVVTWLTIIRFPKRHGSKVTWFDGGYWRVKGRGRGDLMRFC